MIESSVRVVGRAGWAVGAWGLSKRKSSAKEGEREAEKALDRARDGGLRAKVGSLSSSVHTRHVLDAVRIGASTALIGSGRGVRARQDAPAVTSGCLARAHSGPAEAPRAMSPTMHDVRCSPVESARPLRWVCVSLTGARRLAMLYVWSLPVRPCLTRLIRRRQPNRRRSASVAARTGGTAAAAT